MKACIYKNVNIPIIKSEKENRMEKGHEVYRVFAPTMFVEEEFKDKPTALFREKADAIDYAIYASEVVGRAALIDRFSLSQNSYHCDVWSCKYAKEDNITIVV